MQPFVNPFSPAEIEQADLFYDRDRDLGVVCDWITEFSRSAKPPSTELRKNIMIAGVKNIGKTSFVRRALVKLRDDPEFQNLLPVYMRVKTGYMRHTLFGVFADILESYADSLETLRPRDTKTAMLRSVVAMLLLKRPKDHLTNVPDDVKRFALSLRFPNLMSVLQIPTDFGLDLEYEKQYARRIEAEARRQSKSILDSFFQDLESFERYAQYVGFTTIILIVDDFDSLLPEDYGTKPEQIDETREFLQYLRDAFHGGKFPRTMLVALGSEGLFEKLKSLEPKVEDIFLVHPLCPFSSNDLEPIIQKRLGAVPNQRMTFDPEAILELKKEFRRDMTELMEICSIAFHKGIEKGVVSHELIKDAIAQVRAREARLVLADLMKKPDDQGITEFDLRLLRTLGLLCGSCDAKAISGELDSKYSSTQASLEKLSHLGFLSKTIRDRTATYTMKTEIKKLVELDYASFCK